MKTLSAESEGFEPRTCYSQQFSRLPQSTTLPTLLKLRLYRCFQWCKYRTIFNFCKTFAEQILTKLNNRLEIKGIIFHLKRKPRIGRRLKQYCQ